MSVIKNPWWLIPIQGLQSFGFAIFWVAVTEYVHSITEVTISATMFNIVGMLYYSFGNLIGSIVGGLVYEKFGGNNLFRACAIISSIVAISVLAFYYFVEKYSSKNTDEKQNDAKFEKH